MGHARRRAVQFRFGAAFVMRTRPEPKFVYRLTSRSNSSVHRRHSQSGMNPKTPNEQSISRHQNGMPRTAPKISAYGMTNTQAMSPKSNNHRLRTGSRHAPMNAMAITI